MNTNKNYIKFLFFNNKKQIIIYYITPKKKNTKNTTFKNILEFFKTTQMRHYKHLNFFLFVDTLKIRYNEKIKYNKKILVINCLNFNKVLNIKL